MPDAIQKDEGNLHIIFDGPPSHESGRFVEVENDAGGSVNAGEWVKRHDGLWDLVIPSAAEVGRLREALWKIKGGHVTGMTDLALLGDWRSVVALLQSVAEAALTPENHHAR